MNLDAELSELRAALDANPPATIEAIKETERLIDFEFPPDLVTFFELCDGAEGFWGDAYLRINSLDAIRFRNTDPGLQRYFSDLVIFGGDGSDDLHGFLRGTRWTIVQRDPFGDEKDRDLVRGATFLDFIRDLRARPDRLGSGPSS